MINLWAKDCHPLNAKLVNPRRSCPTNLASRQNRPRSLVLFAETRGSLVAPGWFWSYCHWNRATEDLAVASPVREQPQPPPKPVWRYHEHEFHQWQEISPASQWMPKHLAPLLSFDVMVRIINWFFFIDMGDALSVLTAGRSDRFNKVDVTLPAAKYSFINHLLFSTVSPRFWAPTSPL